MPATKTKKKAIAQCTCVEQSNKLLEKQGCNTRISTTLLLNMLKGTSRMVPYFATYKADEKKRERMKTLLFKFCPICGKRMP